MDTPILNSERVWERMSDECGFNDVFYYYLFTIKCYIERKFLCKFNNVYLLFNNK